MKNLSQWSHNLVHVISEMISLYTKLYKQYKFKPKILSSHLQKLKSRMNQYSKTPEAGLRDESRMGFSFNT